MRHARPGHWRWISLVLVGVLVGVVSFVAGVWVGLGSSPGWVVAPVAFVKDGVDEAIAGLRITEVERLQGDIIDAQNEIDEVISELRAIDVHVGRSSVYDCFVPDGIDTGRLECRLRIRHFELEHELEILRQRLALAQWKQVNR